MFRKLMKSKALRTRTSWVVAFILIPPFIVAFHMFSSPTQTTGPADGAGRLFDRPVAWELFQRQYNHTRRQWASRLAGPDGSPVDIPEAFEPLIIEQTWGRLTLIQEAKNRGLRVSDETLADTIRQDPTFQVGGIFYPDRYRLYLNAIGMAPRSFEGFLRDQLLAQQLVDDINSVVSVSDAEIREVFTEANERLQIGAVIVEPDAFRTKVRAAVTEEDLRADFDKRPELIQTAERITFDYLGLTREHLTATLTIPEEEILEYYEINEDLFAAEEEDESPEDETPAAENTDAEGSAAEGTEPEDSEPDTAASETTDPVEAGPVAFELWEETGTPVPLPIAEPVKLRPLEDVRGEIREALLPRYINRRLNALAMDLDDLLAAGESFEDMASALELSPRTFGPFDAGDLFPAGVPDPTLPRAARGLAEGEMSELVETNSGVYVLRITRREPPVVPPFDAVRDAIRDRLIGERAEEAAKTAAEELRGQLSDQLARGVSLDEAAQALGVTVTHPAPISRTDAIEGAGRAPALNTAAFDTPIGEVTEVVNIPKGFAFLIPQELIAPDEADLPDQREALRARLLEEKRAAHFSEWFDDLEVSADLQSFVEELDTGQPIL